MPHAAELLAFAEAAVAGSDEELDRARQAVLAAEGPEGLVDAAAIIGNFQRMVRIADGTGIPLDAPVKLFSEDLREELGINEFESAANTPRLSVAGRWLGRALAPLFLTVLGRFARRTQKR